MSATEHTESAAFRYRSRLTLLSRAAILALTLLLEKYFLNPFVDTRRADAAQGFGGAVRVAQHFGFSIAISLALSLTAFALVDRKRGGALGRVSNEVRQIPLGTRWLVLHGSLLAALAWSLTLWYRSDVAPLWALVFSSVAVASAAILALLIALAPLSLWRRAAAALGTRWLYALGAAGIAVIATSSSQELWASSARLTFALAEACARPFVSSLYADPASLVLATDQFAVRVEPYCSGLEGIGLMLAFLSAWLIYFRKEYVYPRALLLIPAGVALIFSLNAVRIALLLLIGTAGSPNIAIYGFHSEAGWIAFNVAACGMAFVSRDIPWLNHTARERSRAASNPTAAYLLPFLSLLVAGAISHTASGGFETWYGLRLIAAVLALAICFRRLTGLNWRFGWRGVAVGAAVFALWLAAAHLSLDRAGIPDVLARMTPWERITWITVRAATGILAAPVVEELAYRAYLLRRLVAADFEAVPWSSIGWGPLVLSAVTFGVMHDALWWAALGAGIAYGLLLVRTGRIGEAVAAHAITNALLTAWVLGFGQWQLWS